MLLLFCFFRIDEKEKIKYDAAEFNGEVTFQKELINEGLEEFKTSIKKKLKIAQDYLIEFERIFACYIGVLPII